MIPEYELRNGYETNSDKLYDMKATHLFTLMALLVFASC